MSNTCPVPLIYKAVILSNISVSINKTTFLQNCKDTKCSVCFLSYVSVYFPYILEYVTVCRYFIPSKLKLEAYPKFWTCTSPPNYTQGTRQNSMNVIVLFKTKKVSRCNLLEIWVLTAVLTHIHNLWDMMTRTLAKGSLFTCLPRTECWDIMHVTVKSNLWVN